MNKVDVESINNALILAQNKLEYERSAQFDGINQAKHNLVNPINEYVKLHYGFGLRDIVAMQDWQGEWVIQSFEPDAYKRLEGIEFDFLVNLIYIDSNNRVHRGKAFASGLKLLTTN